MICPISFWISITIDDIFLFLSNTLVGTAPCLFVVISFFSELENECCTRARVLGLPQVVRSHQPTRRYLLLSVSFLLVYS